MTEFYQIEINDGDDGSRILLLNINIVLFDTQMDYWHLITMLSVKLIVKLGKYVKNNIN